MNKNFRVITINGFRGIFAAIFIVFGLFSGFILTPGFFAMKFWNRYIVPDFSLPLMNIFQGILFWLIFILMLYVINNKQPLIGFGSYNGLTPEQLKDVLKKARSCELKSVDLKVNNEHFPSGNISDEKVVNVVLNEKKDEDCE